MKKYVLSTVLIAAGVVTGTRIATAQSALLNLPCASQHARISQRMLGVAIFTLAFYTKARREERFLRAELGENLYDAYKRKTAMLVPFVRIES
jgi:protein-S-isoprenylcysteine O-methyltransferase Ste14